MTVDGEKDFISFHFLSFLSLQNETKVKIIQATRLQLQKKIDSFVTL